MKSFAIVVLGLTLFAGTTPLPAQQAGWVELFNGVDLDGWVPRGGKASYVAENGMIVGTTVPNTPNSFLCTENRYGDFELQLQFKVHPDLNSGVQIRSNSLEDYQQGRVHGYQVEIDPSHRAWSGGIYDEARRGWLADLKDNAAARYAFKQGDWNHFRILAEGNSISTWINGVPAAHLLDDMTAEGFVALQVHGVGGRRDPITVSWKEIRIRELGGEQEGMEPQFLEGMKRGEARLLADGFEFTEGPALGPDGLVYFSDVRGSRIHTYDPATGQISVYREPSFRSNGLVWTPNDSLIACESESRRITEQTTDGTVKTIVERYADKRLNSPNDLTLDGVGGFYFTDPRYGNRDDLQQEMEAVYYVSRDRKIARVIDDLQRPNGIELSHDGRTLYVADTELDRVFAWDVNGPGKISNRRVFAERGSDGMTIDELGNLYLTQGNSVHIYGATGQPLHRIDFATAPTNVTFCGPQRRDLFVTARTAVYLVPMQVAGGRAFANPGTVIQLPPNAAER